MPTKAEIKNWLGATGHSRQWLADRLAGTAKKTVDNWLSSSQNIPAGTLVAIARIMEDDDTVRNQETIRAQVFSLEVDRATFRAYNNAALAQGLTIEEWAIKALDEQAARPAAATKPSPPVSVRLRMNHPSLDLPMPSRLSLTTSASGLP